MVDHLKILEAALRCNDTTEKEREVIDILLSLPELVFYGQDQLVPWGWKKRRSAVNTPLAPLPSPADSSPSPPSSPPRKQKSKPRVAYTKEQFLQETNALAQRKKAYKQELLKQISELTERKQIYSQELLKVHSHLQKQRKFNNTLKKLAAGATTVAPSQS